MSETEQGNNGTGPNAQTGGQGGGMDFDRMMQQAAAIKSQQVREARKKFEAMPPFIQHSLFFQEPESIEPRSLPFAPRLEKATAIKDAGNVAFKNKDYRGAVERYERALGCFTWFTSTDPDWKTNGIKDENLRLDRFGGESDEEKAEIQKFEVSCLNNMAAAFLQVKQWDMCGALCSDVIRRDPENAKARYRRAVALSSRPQSGEKELEMAISDLGVALKADPEDKKVNALRSKLLKQKDDNKKKEKETFSGVFNRGEIVVENEKPQQQKLLTPEEIAAKIDKSKSAMLQQIDFLEAMMKQAHAAGKKEETLQLAQHVKTMKDAHVKLVSQEELGPGRPDYRNPTPEMIREAAQFNLDLKDPRIVLELERLEKAKISENGDITEILAKEEAEFLATARAGEQPWLRKNRLAVGVLMVVIALIVFVLMSSPVPKPEIVLDSPEPINVGEQPGAEPGAEQVRDEL